MNEIVDLVFVDRIINREKQLTDGIRENCRVKISRAEDMLEIALEELCRLLKRNSDVTDELRMLDLIGTSLSLQVMAVRKGLERRAEAPSQFWTATELE